MRRDRCAGQEPARELTAAQLDQAASYTLAWLLEVIYPLPAGMEHERDWLRLTHADLEGLSDLEAADERAKARLRLMLDPKPSDWLVERARLLEERSGRTGRPA